MNLKDVLSLWHENHSVDIIVASDFLTSPTLQIELDALTGDERENALKSLSEIATALNAFIIGAEDEQAGLKKQMKSVQKNAEACIRYGHSSHLDKKNRPKE